MKDLSIIDAIVMGMYLPISIMSGIACFLYITRILLPAIQSGDFSLKEHAVALSAILALAAHFAENVYYGVSRFNVQIYDLMNDFLPMVGAMKLLILGSSILSIAVYSKAVFGRTYLNKLTWVTLVLWLIGAALATAFV